MNRSTLETLRLVRRLLHDLDADLRKIVCPKCGKPVSGVIPGPGQPTPEQLNQFCSCVKESQGKEEKKDALPQ